MVYSFIGLYAWICRGGAIQTVSQSVSQSVVSQINQPIISLTLTISPSFFLSAVTALAREQPAWGGEKVVR